MGSQGVSFRRGVHDVTRVCESCKSPYSAKDYEKNCVCPSCRESRNIDPKVLADRRKIVSVACGTPGCKRKVKVQAYTLQIRQRKGRVIYCQTCINARREAGKRAYFESKKKAKEVSERSWMAPCMMKIVPKRAGMKSRCKPALAGRCHMVCECVDFAAKQEWEGWKTAGETK